MAHSKKICCHGPWTMDYRLLYSVPIHQSLILFAIAPADTFLAHQFLYPDNAVKDRFGSWRTFSGKKNFGGGKDSPPAKKKRIRFLETRQEKNERQNTCYCTRRTNFFH